MLTRTVLGIAALGILRSNLDGGVINVRSKFIIILHHQTLKLTIIVVCYELIN